MTRTLAIAALLACSMYSSSAWAEEAYFRTPSKNIYCAYFDYDGRPEVRCDIRSFTSTMGKRPADCDLDFGQAFAVRSDSRRGAAICHGDTVLDPNARALPYGQTWRWRDLSCASSPAGLRCANAKGAGFEISREKRTACSIRSVLVSPAVPRPTVRMPCKDTVESSRK